ncbi:MAG TPA: glycoside hydrolase family 27 protein [Bryobacteraceae bacterium]|jgi:alpha-galactosidase|nr:glycoside hydrolase family 27 protein [Bryobacteraceae bacterium]
MSRHSLRGAILLVSMLCLSGFARPAKALDNSLALTPPMGWNSWNKFGCNVSADLIKSVVDAIETNGMKDAGYQYVVIDDCWQVGRDSQGNIRADPKRFPGGIKAVADYVHSKGLKFGIYSDAGTGTCQNRPGSRGYEFQDARAYASWGVDYLKYDWCNHSTQDSAASYSIMRDALAKSGRPIVFSLCEWGSTKPWLWAKDVGNLWRATTDILNRWSGHEKWGGAGVADIIEMMDGLQSYAGPRHWNDPDMLEVGNGGMTDTEYRTHFSMWCLLAAPLIAGNDVRKMDKQTATILLNKEAIAIDQDPLGREGSKVHSDGDLEIWSKELADGGRAVALYNKGTGAHSMTVEWTQIGYPVDTKASVRDLWEHKTVGSFTGSYQTDVPSHGVAFLRIMP